MTNHISSQTTTEAGPLAIDAFQDARDAQAAWKAEIFDPPSTTVNRWLDTIPLPLPLATIITAPTPPPSPTEVQVFPDDEVEFCGSESIPTDTFVAQNNGAKFSNFLGASTNSFTRSINTDHDDDDNEPLLPNHDALQVSGVFVGVGLAQPTSTRPKASTKSSQVLKGKREWNDEAVARRSVVEKDAAHVDRKDDGLTKADSGVGEAHR
jgi:hypothetical protein